MTSKLEPVIWLRVLVTLAYMKGWTYVRTYVRTYERSEVHDVMAIKRNFLTSMGYHIFLTMVLRARAPSARLELRTYIHTYVYLIMRVKLHKMAAEGCCGPALK